MTNLLDNLKTAVICLMESNKICFNTCPADHDYCVFKSVLLVDQISVINKKPAVLLCVILCINSVWNSSNRRVLRAR